MTRETRILVVAIAVTIGFSMSAQTYRLELSDRNSWSIFCGPECVVNGRDTVSTINVDSLYGTMNIDKITLTYNGRVSEYLTVKQCDDEIFRGKFKDYLDSTLIKNQGGLTLSPGKQYTLSHGENEWKIDLFDISKTQGEQEGIAEPPSPNWDEKGKGGNYTIFQKILIPMNITLLVVCIFFIIQLMTKSKKKARKKGIDRQNLKEIIGKALGLPEESLTLENILREIERLKAGEAAPDGTKEPEGGAGTESRQKPVPQIVPIKRFNVAKNESGSEDADPYIFISNSKLWGVIGVFDGMGGAGHRMYVHNETSESHTSAYWASRYVYDVVDTLIREIDSGDEDPLSFIDEELLRQRIKDKLDEEIIHFPVESSVRSKMLRKFPTTIALCVYKIEDGEIHINTYWAGDSRIYMFDSEQMSFLTIDDADAPDGDPFSPANMDLAVNNTISQDGDFHITKIETVIPGDQCKPFVLLACSDGCFGYYKNPIEFEYMVRYKLETSKDWDEWSDMMKGAIIQNDQSDDLSMVGIAFGDVVASFDEFKEKMREGLNKGIFKEYYSWKRDGQEKQNVIKVEIDKLRGEINLLKGDISQLEREKQELEDKVVRKTKDISALTEPKQSSLEEAENPSEVEPDQTECVSTEDISDLAETDGDNKVFVEEALETDGKQQESEDREVNLEELRKELEEEEKELSERVSKLQVRTDYLKKLQDNLRGKKDELETIVLKQQKENNEWYKKLNSQIVKSQGGE